jgi:chemotaxis protein MotA
MSGLIFLILGFAFLILGFVGEGGHATALISWTSFVIVFGGTIGSLGTSFTMKQLKNIGRILRVAFTRKSIDLIELIFYFDHVLNKVRKDGFLGLEEELEGDENMNPFIKKGLQSAVDGAKAEDVRNMLEIEAAMSSKRHKVGAAMFDSAGGTAPTMGIVGTVLGLVHVLGGLAKADMDALGGSISAAFLATLYGLGSANLIFLPIATRLKNLAKDEQLEQEIIIEAIYLIQENVSPTTLRDTLKGFLDKKDQIKLETRYFGDPNKEESKVA